MLLPLVPVSLLVLEDPELVLWMHLLGTFSMFPLLVRDNLRTPYWAVILLSAVICCEISSSHKAANNKFLARVKSLFFTISYSGKINFLFRVKLIDINIMIILYCWYN